MLKNYIKITLRNMVRNKLFTAINILGLSVSIACCLLLFLYVSDQLSYDTQHGDNVYRVTGEITQKGGSEMKMPTCSVPVGPVIRQEIPEIEEAARLISTEFFGKDIVTLGEDSYYIKNGAAADSTLFQVLKYDIISGNPAMPLPNGNSVVLEKEWAQKLFGNDIAIGKTVKISTGMGVSDYEVTAVYDKSAYRTHLSPSFIISLSNVDWNNFIKYLSSQWVTNNLTYTYVKLSNGAKSEPVVEKIDQIFQRNGAEDMKTYGMGKVMSLQPVSEVHTDIDYFGGTDTGVSMTFINVLIGIGVLILVLACVNYINLSTAQASNRALEVGVRKVMGISSRGLVTQFLGESFIIVFISLVISILLAELTMPIFNSLVDQPIAFTSANIGTIALYMTFFLFVTAFVAGIYPAIYLASFKPTAVLKGKNKDKGGVALLRKILVVGQFVISIVLISAILVISEQVDFIKNKDLGFQSTSRVVVPLANDLNVKAPLLKQKFKTLSQVHQVGGVDYIPGTFIFSDLFLYRKGQTMDDAIHIYQNEVDPDYVKTLGMKLLAGKQFRNNVVDDSLTSRVILNREASRQLGFTPEEAVGEQLYAQWREITYSFNVVGVIEDINQSSLHSSIEPVMFVCGNGEVPNLIVETDLKDYGQTMAALKSVWKELIPDAPFEAFSLNDHLIKQYESDFKTFNLIKYFAIISVFISCMGLYALSMFVAERKFKEIGVRKALGADIKDILLLVSKDLSLLVIIAFVLSVPISIYTMDKWLDGFAYKITQGAWTYVVAGLATILIAWLTIGYQSVRAARTNPIDVLKDE
ncbi:MAG TPA: ABC transporter permease [Fulvivirga sp.]|nr:ABC transporter permease [Fulvivirga sp.]